MPTEPTRSDWVRSLTVLVVLCAFMATLDTLRIHQATHSESWGRSLVDSLAWWGIFGTLTPTILVFVARNPLAGSTWRTVVPRIVPLSVALASIVLAGSSTVVHLTYGRAEYGAPYLTAVGHSFVSFWHGSLLILWGLFGTAYALDHNRRLRDRELAAARLETLVVEARLDALRMEMSPHFLFNALNTVSGLIRGGVRDEAVRVVTRLSELLRATLDGGGAQEVDLERELELLDRYLGIEQIRFGDRLVLDVDVDPESRRALVPVFVLQPLAENAVRHGVSRRAGPHRIHLRARRRDDELRIDIEDTGVGLGADAPHAPSGIGLRNTRARLAHLYGEGASLTLEDRSGGGARATLTLPYHLGTESSDELPRT